jgi:cytochrome c556
MNMKAILAVTGFTVSAIASAGALAQARPETLVKQRQSALTLQGKYFGPLAGMASGKVPYDAAIVTRNVGFLDALSKMPWDGFDTRTSGEKSRALPEVYKEPEKFKEATDKFQAEVGKLVGATRGGNEAAIKTAIGEVGKACDACHDNFRSK